MSSKSITKNVSLDKWPFCCRMTSPCCYKNPSVSSKARSWNLDPALLRLALTASQKCFWETEPRYPSAGTHAPSFLLKLCRFLSVGYSPLHKAHRLVHVAFDSIDHSTLTAGVGSGESNAWKYEGMHRNRKGSGLPGRVVGMVTAGEHDGWTHQVVEKWQNCFVNKWRSCEKGRKRKESVRWTWRSSLPSVLWSGTW